MKAMGRLGACLTWALVCAGCGGAGGASEGSTLTLARAGAGVVGPAGTQLTAQLVDAPDGGPASIQLLAGDTVVGSLARTGPTTRSPRYEGAYVPASGIGGATSIVARAVTSGAAVSSPPLVLDVDTSPPVVTGLAVACSVAHADGQCRRNETLGVTVHVSDGQPVTAAATLDLDGYELKVPLEGTGEVRTGTVSLPAYPFPMYEGSATVRIEATDALGNVSRSAQAAAAVTRLRWEYATGGIGFTQSAIDIFWNVAFGVHGVGGPTTGQLRILRPDCDPTLVPQPTPNCVRTVDLGAGVAVAHAPMVGFGFTRIWFPTTDGKLLARTLEGAPANGAGCSIAVTGTVAMSPRNADVVIANASTMYAAEEGTCDQSAFPGTQFLASSATDATSRSYALSSGSSGTRLISGLNFYDSGLALVETWSSPVGVGTTASTSPIIDRLNRVLVLSGDGKLYRVTDNGTSGTASVLASGLPAGATVSPIILRDDSIVVAVGSQLLRLASSGEILWTAAMTGNVTGILVPAPDRSGVALYVTTDDGKLQALKLDGSSAWGGPVQLATGALVAPNIGLELLGDGTHLLYVGGADGKLRAVIVDSEVDDAAPWPKAFHDVHNSSRAN